MKRVVSSIGDTAKLVHSALRGTSDARELHRRYEAMPTSIAAGVAAFENRCPDIRRSEKAPVFILSAGWRSGSTLLQRLIMTKDLLIWGEPYAHGSPIQTMGRQFAAFNELWPQPEFFFPEHDPRSANLANSWVANLYPSPQAFFDAHLGFFDRLFSDPANTAGYSDWGLKEIRLTTDDAHYLKWLFPNAKFVFLCRNPWRAWGSYRAWRRWYRQWPQRPVLTATQFGRLWAELAADFSASHRQVEGIMVRYEDLGSEQVRLQLERYLERSMRRLECVERVDGRGSGSGRRNAYVPKLERMLLSRQVHDVASHLGYRDS